MTEHLLPLLESTNDAFEFELELLRSMAIDEPGPHLLPATAAALGVGALLASTTNAAAHVSGAVVTAATASAMGTSAGPSSSVWIGVLKSLAVGSVAGIALSGVATLAFHDERTVTQSPAGAVAPSARGPRAAATPRSLTEPTQAPVAEVQVLGKAEHAAPPEARRARQTSEAAASSVASEPSVLEAPHSPASVSIAAEVAALDQARALLRQGQPLGAASVIERYRARWPEGALGREASMLMVEALAGAGDRAGAEREAERAGFGAQADRYSSRVRELLGKPPAR